MTSLRFMFIQLSQLTRWPLYVSPFFNSTSWRQEESNPVVLVKYWQHKEWQAVSQGRARGRLTIGWFWAVFSRDSGSCKFKNRNGSQATFTCHQTSPHNLGTHLQIFKKVSLQHFVIQRTPMEEPAPPLRLMSFLCLASNSSSSNYDQVH